MVHRKGLKIISKAIPNSYKVSYYPYWPALSKYPNRDRAKENAAITSIAGRMLKGKAYRQWVDKRKACTWFEAMQPTIF